MNAEPRDLTPVPSTAEACPPNEDGTGEYWRWCPQCGHELPNEKCKLRCPRCHSFMSCSAFDWSLDCGDLSPLFSLGRLVALAAPRSAVRRTTYRPRPFNFP